MNIIWSDFFIYLRNWQSESTVFKFVKNKILLTWSKSKCFCKVVDTQQTLYTQFFMTLFFFKYFMSYVFKIWLFQVVIKFFAYFLDIKQGIAFCSNAYSIQYYMLIQNDIK